MIEKGNRWCPWFSSGLRVTIPQLNIHIDLLKHVCPPGGGCKQFQLDQNPGRHFIQPSRLHNCVGSPEVLLCIDMEKILHRRKYHISYQCLQADVSHFKDMSQIYKPCDMWNVCSRFWISFKFCTDFFKFPPLKKEGERKKWDEWWTPWLAFFPGRSSSSAAASPPSTEY